MKGLGGWLIILAACDTAAVPSPAPPGPNTCDGLAGGGPWYIDDDGDGFGDASRSPDCAAAETLAMRAGDCDDGDADRSPAAPELCDQLDNNCDGQIDEGLARTGYPDADGDGYGDPAAPAIGCALPAGHLGDGSDCDDTDVAISPVAPERCNDQDDDCDGFIDEDLRLTWYLDDDGDGFGDLARPWSACEAPVGYVADATDCDDGTALASPAGAEICNDGLDNDCDGLDPCTITGSNLLSEADRSWYEADATQLGSALAAGDLDGDGLPDLAVGRPSFRAETAVFSGSTTTGGYWSTQYSDDGAVVVRLGTPEAVAGSYGAAPVAEDISAISLDWRPGISPAGYGEALEVGDIDGDGALDLLSLVGDREPYPRVDVLLGPITDMASGADLEFTSEEDGILHGFAVSPDSDGDGMGELLVAAPVLNHSSAILRVPLPTVGGALADIAVARWFWDDEDRPLTQLGCDTDADGLAEIVTGSSAGIVAVLPGDTTGDFILEDAGILLSGTTPSTLGCVDLDGDGQQDLQVGVSWDDTGGEDAGAVYLVSGPILADADFTASPAFLGSAGDELGTALGSEDLDGDGVVDLVLGAPGALDGAGQVWVVPGPVLAPDLTDAVVFAGEAGSGAGTAVAGAGDSNGDGFGDLAVGAPLGVGGVYLVLGRGE